MKMHVVLLKLQKINFRDSFTALLALALNPFDVHAQYLNKKRQNAHIDERRHITKKRRVGHIKNSQRLDRVEDFKLQRITEIERIPSLEV